MTVSQDSQQPSAQPDVDISAFRGKSADLSTDVSMVDEMVTLFKTQQGVDDSKKVIEIKPEQRAEFVTLTSNDAAVYMTE